MTEDRPLPESGAPYAVRTTRRRGRMSAAKRTALIDLMPRWSLPDPLGTPLTEERLRHAFGRTAPRLLDVGVGTGEATIDWARAHPDHDVVAVELHRPGIARMVQSLDEGGPTNVRIAETDVTRLLDVLTGPEAPEDRPSIEAVRVLFPDPWPKARHRSRRLVDRTFVRTVADLLPPGGLLHLATDWDGYALQMVRALLAEPRFEVDADEAALEAIATGAEDADDGDAGGADAGAAGPVFGHDPVDGPRPWASARPPRPVTTYERRGLEAGRRVTDLVARRRGG